MPWIIIAMMEDAGDQSAVKNKQGASRYSCQRLMWGEPLMVMMMEWPQSSNVSSRSTAKGKFKDGGWGLGAGWFKGVC